jgi:alpha-tubulin suppressor-like RCC1 family protein
MMQMSSGTSHNLVLDTNGKLFAWGSNENKQFPMFEEKKIPRP